MRRMFTKKQVKKVAKEQIDEQVPEMIQADKDILSQIVINEDEETLTLPKHIMPLRLTINSNEYFFDYDEMIIVNDVGEYIGDFSVNHDIVIISIDNDPFENPNVTQIDYILSDNGMEKLSTYYLYHPVTSAGTKLYRHYLGYKEFTTGYYGYFYVITRSATPITSISELETQIKDYNMIQVIRCYDNDKYLNYMAGLYCDFGNMYIVNGINDGSLVTISQFNFGTDTVTEL